MEFAICDIGERLMNGGIRKTALFLSGLPEEAAQTLLKKLEPQDVRKIRVEMLKLSGTPKERVRNTVAEFLSAIDSESATKTGEKRKTDSDRSDLSTEKKPENGLELPIHVENTDSNQEKQSVVDSPIYSRPTSVSSRALNPAPQEDLQPVPQNMDSFVEGVDLLSLGNHRSVELPSLSSDSEAHSAHPAHCIENDPEAPDRRVATDSHSPPESEELFGFLRDLDWKQLQELLEKESAQVIAVVLTHIPSEQAGKVLEKLHPRGQKEVLGRLLQLEEIAPDVLQDIDTALRERRERIHETQRKKFGLKAAQKILKTVDPALRKSILHDFEEEYYQLEYDLMLQEEEAGNPSGDPRSSLESGRRAEPAKEEFVPKNRISPVLPSSRKEFSFQEDRPLLFEDLQYLPDRALDELFLNVDSQTMLLSLLGASTELVDRVVRNFTVEQEKQMQIHLQLLAPIHPQDIEAARKRVIGRIREINTQGPN